MYQVCNAYVDVNDRFKSTETASIRLPHNRHKHIGQLGCRSFVFGQLMTCSAVICVGTKRHIPTQISKVSDLVLDYHSVHILRQCFGAAH